MTADIFRGLESDGGIPDDFLWAEEGYWIIINSSIFSPRLILSTRFFFSVTSGLLQTVGIVVKHVATTSLRWFPPFLHF